MSVVPKWSRVWGGGEGSITNIKLARVLIITYERFSSPGNNFHQIAESKVSYWIKKKKKKPAQYPQNILVTGVIVFLYRRQN